LFGGVPHLPQQGDTRPEDMTLDSLRWQSVVNDSKPPARDLFCCAATQSFADLSHSFDPRDAGLLHNLSPGVDFLRDELHKLGRRGRSTGKHAHLH